MVDKVTFRRINANYPMQQIKEAPEEDPDSDEEKGKAGDAAAAERVSESKLTDDDLLLASPIVYGFSFADKLWCKLPCTVSLFDLNALVSGVQCESHRTN